MTNQSPPQPGELIIVYAWGLGYASDGTTLVAGDVTPTPAPVVVHGGLFGVYVRFDFGQNADPSALYQTPPTAASAYLTPRQVGLYQIHVQLPSTFPPLTSCNPNAGLSVGSNLTITLFTSFSSDGLALCIPPNQ